MSRDAIFLLHANDRLLLERHKRVDRPIRQEIPLWQQLPCR